MARVFEQAVDIGFFHHLAGIHDDDALRGLRHHAHRMGDQHDGHAEAVLHVLQQIEDLRLDGDVERGGRLVGDDELWLAGQRHGDHDALAHAARKLMRVIVQAAGGIGDLHQLEHLHRAGERVLVGEALVAAKHLGDLLADGEHRVERGHRLLENETDILGPDVVQFVACERHEIAALEQDLAFDDAARRHRDQLQDRHRGDGLAAAGFADHAERLALVEGDVDAVDRLQHAVVGGEVSLQALDLEQRRHQITRLASSASRMPSPMKLMATTATKMAPPGNSAQWAAMSRKSLASYSSRPQVGTSGGKPRPRKDRVDSAMMAAATSMVPAMITGPSALGRIWRTTCRNGLAPSARAASTNSFSRNERNWARTRRATGIQRRPPITSTMRMKMPPSGPNAAFSPSRNR